MGATLGGAKGDVSGMSPRWNSRVAGEYGTVMGVASVVPTRTMCCLRWQSLGPSGHVWAVLGCQHCERETRSLKATHCSTGCQLRS